MCGQGKALSSMNGPVLFAVGGKERGAEENNYEDERA